MYLFDVQIANLLSNGIQCFVNLCIACVHCGVLPVTYCLLLLMKLVPSGDLSCQMLLYMSCSFPSIFFFLMKRYGHAEIVPPISCGAIFVWTKLQSVNPSRCRKLCLLQVE